MERDMSEAFNNQMLVEKLSKLNNSQQSIQSILCFKVVVPILSIYSDIEFEQSKFKF